MYLQSHIYKNILVSFDFITTWNQGVFSCSPCILSYITIRRHVSVASAASNRVSYKSTNSTVINVQNAILKSPDVTVNISRIPCDHKM